MFLPQTLNLVFMIVRCIILILNKYWVSLIAVSLPFHLCMLSFVQCYSFFFFVFPRYFLSVFLPTSFASIELLSSKSICFLLPYPPTMDVYSGILEYPLDFFHTSLVSICFMFPALPLNPCLIFYWG